MGFQKEIKLGEVGSLLITEGNGVATLKISVGTDVASGLAKAVASAEVDVEIDQLLVMALDLIKVKLPESVQPLITELEKALVPAVQNA